MKKLITLLLCLCLVIGVAGCGTKPAATTEPASPPAAADAPAARQPELVVAISSEPSNMDITAETTDNSSVVMLGSVWEQLVTVNDDGGIICELAESYDITDDYKQYTYNLRKGVKFHDGQEMLADDVVASMNRWLDFAATADGMVGGARFEKVDDYTVTIKMVDGTAYLNELIGSFGQHAIITTEECIAEAAAAADGFIQSYVGTGPYTWVEWVSASHIELKAWDDYQPYGTDGDYSGLGGYKHAFFDTVKVRFVPDETTLNAGIQTGEYKATTGLSMTYYDSYVNDPKFTVRTDESELQAMIFNKKEGWGANPKFRQAVQALINCDDVLYSYFGNEAYYKLYSSYMFTTSSWYTEAGTEYYNQGDKEKAKALLAEAGFTTNDTFIILCASDSADFYSFAQVIQQAFKEIGFNCELMAYEWGTFAQIRNNEPDKYNAFITSFSPKLLPPLNLFLSASWAGWCTDERIQNDLAAISSATDPEVGMKTWVDLQGYMYEEYVPVVKFGASTNMTVWSSDLTGFGYTERLNWVNARPS